MIKQTEEQVDGKRIVSGNLLESFRAEYEKRGRPQPQPLRTSAEIRLISKDQPK